MYFQLLNPGKPNLEYQTNGDNYNDGEWHSLSIRAKDTQLEVYLDGSSSFYGYNGLDRMRLDGPLYVGKLFFHQIQCFSYVMLL